MATGMSPSAVNHCGDERDESHLQEQLLDRPPKASQQPHHGGYDCEFVKLPPVEFPQTDCPVCLLVLREPHQASCCGNSYCEACVKRVKDNKKCCPTCNQANFTVFPDKRLKRSLYALNVYCSQRRVGCEWEGELGELDRHLNLQPPPEKLLVGCQLSEVECTYCVQPFQRRHVQAHQANDCPKRPFACQHCNQHMATFEEVTHKHWPVCLFFPLSCPNNCKLVLQRQELEHHVSHVCPLTLVQCDFHTVGCKVQLIRKDIPSHVIENLTEHMSLLQRYMTTHPGENVVTYLLLMVGSIQNVAIGYASIRSELHDTQQKLKETCDELQVTRDELKESQERYAQLEASQGRKIVENQANLMSIKDDLTHSITANAQKIQTQAATLNQHQKTLENVTYTGTLPFEFTMTDFELRKKTSDEWFSPPFYTHTQGYKMCIKVSANGALGSKGTHVSVTPRLMRGAFDDGLQWPFEGTITIQLLNQLEDTNHHTDKTTYAYVQDSKQTSRVLCGDKAPLGPCIQDFIPHTQLGFKAHMNCQYLHDDKLKFRVSKVTNISPTSRIYKQCIVLKTFAQSVEPKVCVVPIQFTVPNFEEKKTQNDIWYSPAFYTHPRGYRMCLQVYISKWP